MTDDTALQAVIDATTPEELYGVISGAAADNLSKFISLRYTHWAKIVHPDKNGGSTLANQAFAHLQELHKIAKARVDAGTYGKKAFLATVTSQEKYDLVSLIGSTPVTDVYECLIDDSLKGVFTIAKTPKMNTYIQREAQVLDSLRRLGPENGWYGDQLPEFIETFIYDSNGTHRQVNVFRENVGYITLQEVGEAFPDGVDDRILAWIYPKLLDVIGHAHSMGIYHGGLTPKSILIGLDEVHNVRLINWHASIDTKFGYIPFIDKHYKDFYPPEVFKKQRPTPSVDLFMASKSVMEILKPKSSYIQGFLTSCLIPTVYSRPHDAWKIRTQFYDLIDKIWPKRQYYPLIINER